MRVLVTGMGGELGTRVAQLLEARTEVDEIVGCDFVPPRRRLRRAEFRRINPHHRERLRDFVTDFAPTHVAHLGVYEPASRSTPHQAAKRTELTTMVALSAAARAGAVEYVVVRSGLEIYGGRSVASSRATVPDESVPPAPTSPFGASLLQVETVAAGLRHRHGIGVGALRFAPVVGSHVPSPLGRLLRLPAVPVDVFADPPFSLLHPEDAAARDDGGVDAVARRSGERRGSGCHEPVAGGASRWSRAGSGAPAALVSGVAGRRVLRRGDRAGCRRVTAPRLCRCRRARARRARHRPAPSDAAGVAGTVRLGRDRPDRQRAESAA